MAEHSSELELPTTVITLSPSSSSDTSSSPLHTHSQTHISNQTQRQTIFWVRLKVRLTVSNLLIVRLIAIKIFNHCTILELEGAHESTYLRQVNFYGRPLLAKFLRGHVRTDPGNMLWNLKSVAVTVLEMHLTPINLGGHVTLATPPFRKILRVMSRLSLETFLWNLKCVALTVLELLAFNAHFKLVWLTILLRTHRNTNRQTHFVHLAEIKIGRWLNKIV